MMWLEQKYLMFSPFDISPNLLYTVLNAQPCLILNVNTETTNSILSWFYKMKKIMCLHRPGHFCKISWHIHPHRPGVNFKKVVCTAQIIEIALSIYHLFFIKYFILFLPTYHLSSRGGLEVGSAQNSLWNRPQFMFFILCSPPSIFAKCQVFNFHVHKTG